MCNFSLVVSPNPYKNKGSESNGHKQVPVFLLSSQFPVNQTNYTVLVKIKRKIEDGHTAQYFQGIVLQSGKIWHALLTNIFELSLTDVLIKVSNLASQEMLRNRCKYFLNI